MSAAGDGGFNFGRVVTRIFALTRRNIAVFLILSVLAIAPEMAFSYVRSRLFIVGATGVFTFEYWLVALSSEVVAIFLHFLLQAALTHAGIRDLEGRPVSLGDALTTALRASLSLFVIGILYALGLVAGAVLLIFPAFMLIAAWSVVVPVRIVENTGIVESFSRSARLTSGHRWQIFGLRLVLWVGAIAAEFAAKPFFGLSLLAPTATITNYYIVTAVVRVLIYMITAVAAASVYYELRAAKDGIGSEHLASVFE